jgi:DNA modification methylase
VDPFHEDAVATRPTVKPIAVVTGQILGYSARCEIVLAAFVGKGTTVVAAERSGRRWLPD